MNRKKSLGLVVDRSFVRKLSDTARAYDVAKDPGKNCFEGNWSGSQVWAVPDDKPKSWDAPLTPGAWGPSELVGDVRAEWLDDHRAELVVEIYARELIDYRRKKRLKDKTIPLNERYSEFREGKDLDRLFAPEEWEELFSWLEAKAWELIRLAQAMPDERGTRCPFCAGWVLYPGELLNRLLDHIAEDHPERVVRSVNLGEQTTIQTTGGNYPLERA